MPCINSLIADYKTAGGFCSGSDIPCDQSGAPGDALCSNATESLLLKKDCRDYIFNNKFEVYLTIDQLIYSM